MSLETLIKIANALGVSADILLADYLVNSMPAQETYLSSVLNDCFPFECKVILDAALSLKEILRQNKFLADKKTPPKR